MPQIFRQDWFKKWFESHYYHLLYSNRDDTEAEKFIDKLIHYLQPKPASKALDLACGKGRHAVYLHKKQLHTDGLDLSSENVKEAKNQETENLQFYCQDMRIFYRKSNYDYIFSMFTSFGYFEQQEENLKVMQTTFQNLKPKGRFILDFLNTEKVLHQLPQKEEIKKRDVHFFIEKYLHKGFIVKEIQIKDGNQEVTFCEFVKAITQEQFLELFQKAGFKVLDIFGNYSLEPFHKMNSERMIFIAERSDR